MEKRRKSTTDVVSLWTKCAERGGDRDWSRLLERLDGLVRFYLREKLLALEGRASAETVEDLAQEVYCRLIDHGRRALRGCRAHCKEQVYAYLKRVATTVAIDRYRREKAQKRAYTARARIEHELALRAQLRDRERLSPEQRLLAAEARLRMRRQIVAMSDPDRVGRDGWIFERAVLDGWTSREISAQVGLSASSVDSLVYRMRRRLGAAGVAVPDR